MANFDDWVTDPAVTRAGVEAFIADPSLAWLAPAELLAMARRGLRWAEYSHTVLLTNLANRVQPIIRYDLGDSVLAKSGPCGCGNPLPAIRVAGRRDDVLRLLAADAGAVWITASAKLLEYLAGLELGNVGVVRAEEPPEQSGQSGKYRQVIARLPD